MGRDVRRCIRSIAPRNVVGIMKTGLSPRRQTCLLDERFDDVYPEDATEHDEHQIDPQPGEQNGEDATGQGRSKAAR